MYADQMEGRLNQVERDSVIIVDREQFPYEVHCFICGYLNSSLLNHSVFSKAILMEQGISTYVENEAVVGLLLEIRD
jgi:hypothetical protein